MKKVIPILSVALLLGACDFINDHISQDETILYETTLDYSSTTFVVDIDADEWNLTGAVSVDGKTYEAYDAGDAESVPDVVTDDYIGITYGSLDSSSESEIIEILNAASFTITKISETELQIYVKRFVYKTTRTFIVEVECDGVAKYIIINQVVPDDIAALVCGCVFYSEPYLSEEYLGFCSNGASYIVESRYDFQLPDTGAVDYGEVWSHLYLYTAAQYSLYEYVAYPANPDDGYPLETTTGFIDGSDTEQVVKIYDPINDITVTKLKECQYEITVGKNPTSTIRVINLNFLRESETSTYCYTFDFEQYAE